MRWVAFMLCVGCSGSIVQTSDGSADAVADTAIVDDAMDSGAFDAVSDTSDGGKISTCPKAGAACTAIEPTKIFCMDSKNFVACDGMKWWGGECPKDAIPGSCYDGGCNAPACVP